MVYSTPEHYNLGQLRAERIAGEENSVNHVNDRYYKAKSQSGKENIMLLLSGKYKCNYRIHLHGY